MQQHTFAQALDSSKVSLEQLQRDYRPMLSLVRALIGVVPNCDGYLEIWPPAFRAYNLLVPNALNLPGLLYGWGAPKDLVGLAMYASSRAAECMYCSAHTCSFALRRGASEAAILGEGTALEQAVVELAASISQVPARIPQRALDVISAELFKPDVEWLLWAVALMGFLNKFMDAMGVELEPAAIADVQNLIGPTAWTPGRHLWGTEVPKTPMGHKVPKDDFSLYLSVLGQAPGAMRLEQQWTKGMGLTAGAALETLEKRVGYGFPRLATLHHRRPVIALGTVLGDQLDPKQSVLGLEAKCLAGLVYAEQNESSTLKVEMRQLLATFAPNLAPLTTEELCSFARKPTQDLQAPSLSEVAKAAAILAKHAGSSPARISQADIATLTQALSPAQIIETLAWLGVLQLMHRLYVFGPTLGCLN